MIMKTSLVEDFRESLILICCEVVGKISLTRNNFKCIEVSSNLNVNNDGCFLLFILHITF